MSSRFDLPDHIVVPPPKGKKKRPEPEEPRNDQLARVWLQNSFKSAPIAIREALCRLAVAVPDRLGDTFWVEKFCIFLYDRNYPIDVDVDMLVTIESATDVTGRDGVPQGDPDPVKRGWLEVYSLYGLLVSCVNDMRKHGVPGPGFMPAWNRQALIYMLQTIGRWTLEDCD